MNRVEELEERIAELQSAYAGLLDEYMAAKERLRTLETFVDDGEHRERTTTTAHATVTETRRTRTPDGVVSEVGEAATTTGTNTVESASQEAVDAAVREAEVDSETTDDIIVT